MKTRSWRILSIILKTLNSEQQGVIRNASSLVPSFLTNEGDGGMENRLELRKEVELESGRPCSSPDVSAVRGLVAFEFAFRNL